MECDIKNAMEKKNMVYFCIRKDYKKTYMRRRFL